MVIGAGTVRNTAQFLDAIAAGAQFTVAPGSEKGTMEAARNEGILHVPGVFTATEVEQAYGMGYRLLKLFPAAELGPSYLKSLRAPLNDVNFIPTGGIDATNAHDGPEVMEVMVVQLTGYHSVYPYKYFFHSK